MPTKYPSKRYGALGLIIAGGLIAGAALGVGGGLWYAAATKTITIQVPVIEGEGAAGVGSRLGWDPVKVAEAKSKGRIVGCGDSIEYVTVEIEPTDDIVSAAYRALFQGDALVAGTPYTNPISYHQSPYAIGENGPDESKPRRPLAFTRVEVASTTASVYLTGEYTSTSECELPQMEAVLTFAAKKHNPSITDVRVYIDGVPAPFEGK